MASPRCLVLSREQTIAKASQSRRKKREKGQKTYRKQVEKGLHKLQSCGASRKNIEKPLRENVWNVVLNVVHWPVMRGGAYRASY